MRAAGALAVGAADGLAGLALGLGGDGAGVDDDGVVVSVGGVAAHDLAFVGVQPAAEGEHGDAHARQRVEVDGAAEGGGDRAGHQHVVVRAPFDAEFAAVEHHGRAGGR